MHNTFNVLDSRQDVQRNYLLEASAGTGKTFSIENIVVRLLIEGDNPLSLEQILVVTFTRAATRDLKMRIRANIERALSFFQSPDSHTSAPDYLHVYSEKGDEAVLIAKRRLEQALFCFDQGQIFTIHGFCSRMLRENVFEGNLGVDAIASEEMSFDTDVIAIIRNFFRTELRPDCYSTVQLSIILDEYGSNTEKLEEALSKVIKSNIEIESLHDFSHHFARFKQVINKIKSNHLLTSKNILADFSLQAPAYEKLCDRSKNIKTDVLDKVERFARLFDQEDWQTSDFDQLLKDGLFLVEAFDPKRRLKTGKVPSTGQLHHPDLVDNLRKELFPLVEEARNPWTIFARMAHGCQLMLRKHALEEEKLGFDDLLQRMRQGLNNPLFVERVRQRYKAAIIDEFQDTDPVQWEVFRILFMTEDHLWGNLYLVGDPKQSIYAFRQADIYTYLAAADALGSDNHASLNTNYRSQPSLVYALNALFAEEAAPGLIALPRIDKVLEYQAVKPSYGISEKLFSDSLGSVHFCIAMASDGEKAKLPIEELEKECILPFMAQEIARMHVKDGMHFNQFAVLVSDRFQAQRVATFFKEQLIPSVVQRAANLAVAVALPAMRELLQAVLYSRQGSALKTALGGRIIGWTHTEIRTLENSSILENVLAKFNALRKILLTDGFAAFFHHLLQSQWHETSDTVAQRLLSQEGGADLYDDLYQIACLLMEEEQNKRSSPEALIALLDDLSSLDISDDPRLKRISDNSIDAVNILTLHSSKGLEFDVVFAPGLITRTRAPGGLLPIQDDQGVLQLRVIADKEALLYRKHCQELDAEKIRQLYVAMTRAKYRLYVPVVLGPGCKAPELGCASPMELFLARLGQPKIEQDVLYERIHGYDGKILCQFIDGIAPEIKATYCVLERNPVLDTVKVRDIGSAQLIPPEKVFVPGGQQYMYSFTALTSKSGGRGIVGIHGELNPPHDFQAEIKTQHTLPSGSEVGNILHELLETISFESVQKASSSEEILPLVQSRIKGTDFSTWGSVIAQVIYQTLKLPLRLYQPLVENSHFDSAKAAGLNDRKSPHNSNIGQLTIVQPRKLSHCRNGNFQLEAGINEVGGNEIRLCDLPQSSRYHEMEFLYPSNGLPRLEELELSDGFLKGVIDLLFVHEGKYYILDWKSNWLGPSTEFYERRHMEQAMQDHQYFLQASVYTIALKRYLRLVDSRPFEEIFGGALYIFLRGIDERQENGVNGVLHFMS